MDVYHMLLRVDRLRDDTLYTLNTLKRKHPDLYERALEKYSWRPQSLEQYIPHLDCLWGDVVFLSPVHPDRVCAALARHRCRSVPVFPYHAIPIADLNVAHLAIWLFRSPMFDPVEVLPFDTTILEQSQDIPEATVAYFEAQRIKQEAALFFFHVPHVLYKGSIDVSAYPLHYTSPYEPPS